MDNGQNKSQSGITKISFAYLGTNKTKFRDKSLIEKLRPSLSYHLAPKLYFAQNYGWTGIFLSVKFGQNPAVSFRAP